MRTASKGININNFFGIFLIAICLLISSFLIVILRPNEYDSLVKLIGVFVFTNMIISTVAVYRISGRINFSVIFIILAYIFSFGQTILFAFGYELSRTSVFSVVNGYFTTDELYYSSLFSLWAIGLTGIGICFVNKKKIKELRSKPIYVDENRARSVGWLLLLISIIPTLYCSYLDIITTFSLSYGETIKDYEGFAKICSLISGFFTSAILMLFCFEGSKVKRKAIWIVLGVYAVMQLAGGSRMSIVRLGICILLLWGFYFKIINRKRFIQLSIVIAVTLFVLSLISATRVYFNSTTNLVELMTESGAALLKDNYLFKIISEMGNSQIVNMLVFKFCPGDSPFQYGLSYLKMVSAIIPSLGWNNMNFIGVDITFSALYQRTGAYMGATYMAEGFWNFGWFSLPLFALFGAVIGKISRKFYEMSNVSGGKATTMFMMVYLLNYMSFIARGELLGLGRSFVWHAIIPVFLCKLRFRTRMGEGKSYNDLLKESYMLGRKQVM